jgi:ubiquinone/menaquinone biosynthesis C-methylase UbiE
MSERPEKPTEFDSYAENYAALIRDPFRERFTASDRFFAERKIQVIRKFYQQRGIDTRKLAWLDVGCGQGDLLRLGKSHFGSATGTDPSSGMLAACSDLDVRQQPSPDQLPFEDRTFDFITAVCVYHHVPETQRPAFTREILRLLKPGGIFSVIEHNPLNPVTRLIVSRTPVDADAHLLTAMQARKLLTMAGCNILDTRYFLFLPEWIHRHFGRVEDRLGRIPAGGQYCIMCTDHL